MGRGVVRVGFLQTEPKPARPPGLNHAEQPAVWGGGGGPWWPSPAHSAAGASSQQPSLPQGAKRGKASVLGDLHSVWNLKGSFHLF